MKEYVTTNETAETSKPLYAQIAEDFARRIGKGELVPGNKLPSQTEMMARFNVSQATVRQAILNLSNQGLVIARQGKGVFVTEPKVAVDLGDSEALANGNTATFTYEHLGSDLIAAPDRMAEILQIEPGSHMIRCRRRLLLQDRTAGLETCNLPFDVMQTIRPEVIASADLRLELTKDVTAGPYRRNFRISAGQVTAFDAELIGVPTETTILQREDTTVDRRGRPLLMSRSVFLADIVTLAGDAQVGMGE
ncbi:GntR family transcriptional regulator [Epibacterium ulvae]|uniref:GntR family transcriptional regulator n=1 Tax=Epibacterium ulvae TaxID=1156985 RepID=UPI001BFCC141|nr:GntR family transcriptional regulator [Epibacterium ulvae]MBT8155592.1 GntR family transcriptional regulator [Epibacterium ulvae]